MTQMSMTVTLSFYAHRIDDVTVMGVICFWHTVFLPLETDLYPRYANLEKCCLTLRFVTLQDEKTFLHHHSVPNYFIALPRALLPSRAVPWRCTLYNKNDFNFFFIENKRRRRKLINQHIVEGTRQFHPRVHDLQHPHVVSGSIGVSQTHAVAQF